VVYKWAIQRLEIARKWIRTSKPEIIHEDEMEKHKSKGVIRDKEI
jgi:hypothetical protein